MPETIRLFRVLLAAPSDVAEEYLMTVYRSELEISPLGIREWTQVLGGSMTLLGREQLREYHLDYDGSSGNVILTR